MRRHTVVPEELRAVFPVPPLARLRDGARSIDWPQSQKIADHIRSGGIRQLLYGGNAFLYHITLAEYEPLLEWLAGQDDELWVIPSAGPSFGRAMDQAHLLRKHRFPAVMLLPCADPRDAGGLDAGLRAFADASETKLILYLKDENNFGSDKEAGLDVVGRLVGDGICVAIKYAVVRENPATDAYLDALLRRVNRKYVVSGIGERPAIVHMRDFGLPGFTTGSGCVAPSLSQSVFEACSRRDYTSAAALRKMFLPLEDLRDAWGPARVLHAAAELAGVANTGPIPPFVSEISESQRRQLAPVAEELFAANAAGAAAVAVR